MFLKIVVFSLIFLTIVGKGFCDESESQNVITLKEAISLALRHNPDLSAFHWEIYAKEGEIRQAKIFPNPILNATLEDAVGSGTFKNLERSQTTLELNQPIELGGKRFQRNKETSLSYDLAKWDYRIKKYEIITEVSKAFIRVLSSQERVKLMEEMIQLTEQVISMVTAKVNAGQISPVALTKAQVTLAMTQIDFEHAVQDLEVARIHLATLWGEQHAHFKEVEGDLEPLNKPIPSLDQLMEKLHKNPRLTRWEVQIAQHKARLGLEKAKRIPDLTVRGGYRWLNESEDHTFLVGIALPLPLFDRNQGFILKADSQLKKALEKRRAAELKMKNSLTKVYYRFEKARFEEDLLKTKALSGAKQAFEAVEESYRQGKLGYLEVVDAQKTLFEAKLRYLKALTNYHRTIIEIERWVGNLTDMDKEK